MVSPFCSGFEQPHTESIMSEAGAKSCTEGGRGGPVYSVATRNIHKKHSTLFQLPTSQSKGKKKKFYLRKKTYWWRGWRMNYFQILLEMWEKVYPIPTSGILNAGSVPSHIIQYSISACEKYN